MTQSTTRRDLLRPLHLLGLALAAGVFALVVTLVTTGAFTSRVNLAIASGAYQGMHPVTLAFVIGGISFIVTLLGLALMMLAIDPADVTREVDKPVLYDEGYSPDVASSDDAQANGGKTTK
ncbi:hypothetical protein [Microbacterium sp. YY-01]|uniref:hypothetical protein n=1 Tax=Microbacterium sp. YY-01 TaxID=3421634 RepID=UPI003D17D7B3